jgi:hypothetical protein
MNRHKFFSQNNAVDGKIILNSSSVQLAPDTYNVQINGSSTVPSIHSQSLYFYIALLNRADLKNKVSIAQVKLVPPTGVDTYFTNEWSPVVQDLTLIDDEYNLLAHTTIQGSSFASPMTQLSYTIVIDSQDAPLVSGDFIVDCEVGLSYMSQNAA